jgi:hypothetical protein
MTVTVDRCQRLQSGAHTEAAGLLDRYLDAQTGRG